MIVLIRVLYLVWVVVALGLVAAALSQLIFGRGLVLARLNDFVSRVFVSVLWPIALLSPRGRYLLWTRWRDSGEWGRR